MIHFNSIQRQQRRTARLRCGPRRRGGILIIVLVVIAMLSLGVLTFSDLTFTEVQATRVNIRQAQARALADSGVDLLQRFLVQDAATLADAGGLFDNPGRFQSQLVADHTLAANRGRFSILAAAVENGEVSGVRFGLEDESTKLNLNTLTFLDKQQPGAGQQLLMALPGMTAEVADAILDYLDEDEDPRENGAESDYYSSLDQPISCKNKPLETVDELLLVRGVLPELLYGTDTNRNGIIDEAEQNGARISDSADAPPEADRGWASYLTLYSIEGNLQPDKTPRINLNGDDMQVLYDELTAASNTNIATYVVAYRQNGPYTGTQPGSQQSTAELDFTKKGGTKLTSVLDLIGSKTQIKTNSGAAAAGRSSDADQGPVLESPFKEESSSSASELPDFLDKVTTNTAKTLPGRVNINQASEVILKGIPGMTTEMVEQIISSRSADPLNEQPSQRHETWLLSEGIVTLDEMRTMLPFICSHGSAYRAQIVGYFDDEGPAARIEAVIDTSSGLPRIVFWRDMSHLGRGYSLETLGAAAE